MWPTQRLASIGLESRLIDRDGQDVLARNTQDLVLSVAVSETGWTY